MHCTKCEYELKDDMNFCPKCGTKVVSTVSSEIFTDQNGKEYNTVIIGNQIWMAENLAYEVDGSKCYGEDGEVRVDFYKSEDLSNDEIKSHYNKYGRLYDWKMAKKVCPKGWHLPDNTEWNELFYFVCNDIPTENSMVGKYLKAKENWSSWFDNKKREKNGNGVDKFGFAALPGGCYDNSSRCRFEFIGEYGCWWSASEDDTRGGYLNSNTFTAIYAYHFYMNHDKYTFEWGSRRKRDLCSVRYVKD